MNTFRAAICDDNQKVLDIIYEQLQRAYNNHDFPIQFDKFFVAQDLLANLYSSVHYDILFLDIDMPTINGIDLCRKIRKITTDILVVFISSKEQLVFQSMEVQPFRFIRKNYFSEELPALIRDTIRELTELKGTVITMNELHSKKVYSINIVKVLYIEVISKYCKIITTTGEFQIQYRIKNLETLLSPYGFLRPHRSYLVNYRYIFSIQKDCLILDNNISIPLSRKCSTQIKEDFIILNNGGPLC